MDSLIPLALRLLPGDELKSSLDSIVLEQGIPAAFILTCAGSLTQAALGIQCSS